jgi:hypothetical protein
MRPGKIVKKYLQGGTESVPNISMMSHPMMMMMMNGLLNLTRARTMIRRNLIKAKNWMKIPRKHIAVHKQILALNQGEATGAEFMLIARSLAAAAIIVNTRTIPNPSLERVSIP